LLFLQGHHFFARSNTATTTKTHFAQLVPYQSGTKVSSKITIGNSQLHHLQALHPEQQVEPTFCTSFCAFFAIFPPFCFSVFV
jgi:hypothetical protein